MEYGVLFPKRTEIFPLKDYKGHLVKKLSFKGLFEIKDSRTYTVIGVNWEFGIQVDQFQESKFSSLKELSMGTMGQMDILHAHMWRRHSDYNKEDSEVCAKWW